MMGLCRPEVHHQVGRRTRPARTRIQDGTHDQFALCERVEMGWWSIRSCRWDMRGAESSGHRV